MTDKTLFLLRMLVARLERISADSFWAHRASGVKGSLLRMISRMEQGSSPSQSEVTRLMNLGFYILERAAHEKHA